MVLNLFAKDRGVAGASEWEFEDKGGVRIICVSRAVKNESRIVRVGGA